MSDESAAERLRVALDMFEFGERMQEARLTRERPDATDDDIATAMQDWLLQRPGAPIGDAIGHASDRFT